MMNKERKIEIIEKYKCHGTDVGSPEVQVACLTARIEELNKHFALFPKDFHSRTGLMRLVGRRRRLLDYLKKHSEGRYEALIKSLGLRR